MPIQESRLESIKSYLNQEEIRNKLPLLFDKIQVFDKKNIERNENSVARKVVKIPKYKHKKDYPIYPFFKPISKM